MDKAQLEELLASLVRSGGSTLHLMAGRPPSLRIQGSLVPADQPALSAQVIADVTRDFLFADHRARLEKGEEVDILYSSGAGARFRTTVMAQSQGLSVVFRRLMGSVPSFEELGLPDVLGSFLGLRSGLVMLTGFFGSGKSTTLASMVDRLNRERPAHVMCLEDGIDFIHETGVALIHQREVGTHVNSVSDGVREAFRVGAEVIVIGNVESVGDVSVVLDAVERGCLVLAAMHSNSIVSCLSAMMHRVPADERPRAQRRFARCVRAMMSQTLLQRAHGKGRVPLFEILIRSRAIERAIASGEFERLPDLMRRGHGLGMQTTDQALVDLLNRNVISVEEAEYHATDREFVRNRGARLFV